MDIEFELTAPSPTPAEQMADTKGHEVADKISIDEVSGSCVKVRYLVVFAAFLANTMLYAMRIILSVTIVAMSLEEDGTRNDLGPEDAPQYDWDVSTRSTILSSFFWGYIFTQVPFGYAAQRFGPRYILFISILMSSVMTVLFVPAAALGWHWACATRIILGLFQGGLLPCSHALISRWSPAGERGRMTVYAYTGQSFGTVIAMSGSGVISATIGWPVVFYLTGILGVITALVWVFLVANSPDQHRYASPQERAFIETSIREAAAYEKHDTNEPLRTPWRAIVTSPPVYALIIVHSAQMWGFWTLLTEIPSYMNGVLNYDLAQNGVLSAVPYLVMWGFGLILSWVSDWALKKKWYNIGTSRKLGNSLAHYGAAIALIVLGYIDNNNTTAFIILTLAVGISAGTMIGYQVNYIDLSHNYASTLMGIGNGISNIFSILGPLAVGFIVTDDSNAEEWRIVFLIAAVFYLVGNTVFVLFGSGEEQPWSDPQWKHKKSFNTKIAASLNNNVDVEVIGSIRNEDISDVRTSHSSSSSPNHERF